jgi:hypothetical protein
MMQSAGGHSSAQGAHEWGRHDSRDGNCWAQQHELLLTKADLALRAAIQYSQILNLI